MQKFTGFFIAAAVAGTVWWQFPNVTDKSLTAQTGRTTSSSSAAYQETARRLMQQAHAEARRGSDASARHFALQASRFSVKWSANELSPTQLLSQLQRGRTAPPQQLNPASIAGRQTVTPTQPKPSSELVTRASGTAANSSQPTITQTGFRDSKPRSATIGSTGETSMLHKRVDQYMVRARADSDRPKAPVSPFSFPTDFSATPGQPTASAAAPDRVLERLGQPAPTGQTTNNSDDELAKQLLTECRQLMRDGRFDDARAVAIRAKNLNVTFNVLSDTPQVVLRDIDFISRTMALTESSQAKLDTLPDNSPFQAPADPTTAALASQNEKHATTQERHGSAKKLVEEPHDLKAAYLPFDEGPANAVADIERLRIQFTLPSPSEPRKALNPFTEPVELISSNRKANSLRKRVDHYMPQARAAGQKGDRDGAVRQATVAALLPDTVNFQPGEQTLAAFLNGSRDAVTIPFHGSFEEIPPFEEDSSFEAAPEELLTEAYEELQLTPVSDDSESIELVTYFSSSVTKVTQAESSAPTLIAPAANAHEPRKSLLSLPSAQGVGVWVKNDAPLELPTVTSN